MYEKRYAFGRDSYGKKINWKEKEMTPEQAATFLNSRPDLYRTIEPKIYESRPIQTVSRGREFMF